MAFLEPFTAANGTNVSDLPGWDDTGTLGAFRPTVAGTNRLGGKGDSGSGNGAARCPDQGAADHYSQIESVVFASTLTSIVVRMVDKDNWWGLEVGGTGGGGLRLYKCIAGTVTTIASTQPVSGATYRINAVTNGIDTDLEVIEVGVGVKLSSTEPNSDVSGTETRQGIVNRGFSGGDTNYRQDNFEAGAIGGTGPVLAITSFAA